MDRLWKVLRTGTMAVALFGGATLLAGPAKADLGVYTFSGTGTGDVSGTPFMDQAFTFQFIGNTANVVPDTTFFRLFGLGGTFSEGGSTYGLTATKTIVASSDPGLRLINFFNGGATAGLGGFNTNLSGYNLKTSIGPLGLDPLTPTFGGGFFGLVGGGRLVITGNTALTFQAEVIPVIGVPEPASLALLGAGLLGLGALRRRD